MPANRLLRLFVVTELLWCKDEDPLKDEYYTIFEISYIIHTFSSALRFCVFLSFVRQSGFVTPTLNHQI